MTHRRLPAILLPLVLAAASARSQEPEPLVTDRPDFTESAVTVAPRRVQVEGGATASRIEDEDGLALGEMLARIGLTARSELRLGLGSWTRIEAAGERTSGFEDLTIGIKLRLAEGGPPGSARPASALILASSAPTGGERVGAEGWQPEAVLALAWEPAPGWSLASNLGWARALDGDRRFDQRLASLAAGRELTPRLGGYLEVYVVSPDGTGGPDAWYLDTGVTLLLAPDLQLDARIGQGLAGRDPDWFAGVGFAWRR